MQLNHFFIIFFFFPFLLFFANTSTSSSTDGMVGTQLRKRLKKCVVGVDNLEINMERQQKNAVNYKNIFRRRTRVQYFI